MQPICGLISAKNTEMPSESKPDISDRDDLLKLMGVFYEKMLADPELAPIFTEVARIDLDTHLPILVDFWDGILFGGDRYRNNAMAIHLDLHRKSALTQRHFDLWLGHLNASVDELFSGEMAHLLKTRALSIATVMRIKTVQADGLG
jgi:hemoglobin